MYETRYKIDRQWKYLIKEIKNILSAVIQRDNIILINGKQKAEPNVVNLHWWQVDGNKQNVGDMLSVVVTEYMRQKTGPQKTAVQKAHLYAIGSIIDGGYQDATVWGSGLLRGKNNYWWRLFRKLDIRCVRGPLTRAALEANGYVCDEIYGDPAMLMPLIYPAKKAATKEYPYIVVPHYSFQTDAEHVLCPMTDDWKFFLDEILKAELVISSSLHGIILAEAYRIPAILLNDHDMQLFKYRDYYYSTGRYAFPIAKTVEEALLMTPAELPNIEKMQKAIMESFPKDLWE